MCSGKPSVIEEPKKMRQNKQNVFFNKYSTRDIYINKYTYDAILTASFLMEKTADEIFGYSINERFVDQKKPKHAFLNIRPPGHHAGGEHQIHGFCFMNNAIYLVN
jgi:acetoin utilization deacetylase AcuC-like enzyme